MNFHFSLDNVRKLMLYLSNECRISCPNGRIIKGWDMYSIKIFVWDNVTEVDVYYFPACATLYHLGCTNLAYLRIIKGVVVVGTTTAEDS